MTISATGIKENSKIFITPLNSTDKQQIIVSAKNIGESFEVSLDPSLRGVISPSSLRA